MESYLGINYELINKKPDFGFLQKYNRTLNNIESVAQGSLKVGRSTHNKQRLPLLPCDLPSPCGYWAQVGISVKWWR